MAVDPVDCELEAERASWRIRLANLEMLLCELLVKNERLRQRSQMPASFPYDQESILTDPERTNCGLTNTVCAKS
jgi:hypothetical protein